MKEIRKTNYHITIADLAPHVHSFLPNENKVEKIFNWLRNWIMLSLECNKIHPHDLLPSKADLACHIGVSQGTIQNVFRLLEDDELVESKQRLGTFIKGKKSNVTIEKLTSKRELAIEIIKKYISENNYKYGEELISVRKLSQITGISNTTLRAAITNLVQKKILIKKNNRFFINNLNFGIQKVEVKTLVEKIAQNLREYIHKNLKEGEKIPSNSKLSKMFNVSVKTIHDAIKILTKEGLLHTRRGQYGTVVADESHNQNSYLYIKYEQKIKQYIAESYNIGDKLLPIKELAKLYATSEKTIKKALDNLAEDGYITYTRGRYGGTFITDIPQTSNEAYKWLAINTEYISN